MNSTFETLYEAVDQLAATVPANPVEPYFAAAWIYMVKNFSRFTIANWFSVLWHEVKTGAYTHTSASTRWRLVLINIPLLRVLGGVLWTVLARIRESVHTANVQFQDSKGVCSHARGQ